MDEDLWRIENFDAFLDARRILLAEDANRQFEALPHGDDRWLTPAHAPPIVAEVLGGFASDEEQDTLLELNEWLEEQGLSPGQLAYELVDPQTGAQRAILDLAWPSGVQEELSEPVTVVLNEAAELIALANAADFRCFVSVEDFKRYVNREILEPQGSDGASRSADLFEGAH